jgi:hypothetical protein
MGGLGAKTDKVKKRDKWQTKGKSWSSLLAVTALITLGICNVRA